MLKNKKKTIHFILPSGGVRGSFQAGCIYHLKKNYSELFEIYRIDGTSIGAMNGLACCVEDPEVIRNVWFSENNAETIFEPWVNNSFWKNIVGIYQGFFQHGMFNNKGLKKNIRNVYDKIDKSYLPKYNCVVTDMTNGKYEYINGTSNNLIKYVVASSSPIIISEPITINNIVYCDGNLLQTYPIDFVEDSKADIKLLIGYDIDYHASLSKNGNTIIHGLYRQINILRKFSVNLTKMPKYIEKYNIVKIDNPVNFEPLDISIENITTGFNLGMEYAEIFAKKYLLDT